MDNKTIRREGNQNYNFSYPTAHVIKYHWFMNILIIVRWIIE